MSPAEVAAIRALREDISDYRDEVRQVDRKMDDLAEAVRPVIGFYTTSREVVYAVGRFTKWGFGLGAAIVSILGGLRIFGIL